MKIVLATTHPHKIQEILQIWGGVPFQILTLKDFSTLPPLCETGSSFAENALQKARIVAQATRYLAVADDSGLEVDSLGGRPGIYSARYAGEKAKDKDNLYKVVEELKALDPHCSQHRGRFRCAAAWVDPTGNEGVEEGTIEGMIITCPRGEKGFGYDPIFWVPHLQKTLSEVDSSLKNRISHRSQAFQKIKQILTSTSRLHPVETIF